MCNYCRWGMAAVAWPHAVWHPRREPSHPGRAQQARGEPHAQSGASKPNAAAGLGGLSTHLVRVDKPHERRILLQPLQRGRRQGGAGRWFSGIPAHHAGCACRMALPVPRPGGSERKPWGPGRLPSRAALGAAPTGFTISHPGLNTQGASTNSTCDSRCARGGGGGPAQRVSRHGRSGASAGTVRPSRPTRHTGPLPWHHAPRSVRAQAARALVGGGGAQGGPQWRRQHPKCMRPQGKESKQREERALG